MTEPRQKRGRSKQDHSTPWEFIRAVQARFGFAQFDLDLAASADNAKAIAWIDAKRDVLSLDWDLDWDLLNFHNAWLNPEFANIAPYALRAAHAGEPRRRIFMLTPASIGTDWFIDHVHGKALVLGLHPRITFVGEKHPYPKDLMLSVFGEFPGFGVWRWKQ